MYSTNPSTTSIRSSSTAFVHVWGHCVISPITRHIQLDDQIIADATRLASSIFAENLNTISEWRRARSQVEWSLIVILNRSTRKYTAESANNEPKLSTFRSFGANQFNPNEAFIRASSQRPIVWCVPAIGIRNTCWPPKLRQQRRIQQVDWRLYLFRGKDRGGNRGKWSQVVRRRSRVDLNEQFHPHR